MDHGTRARRRITLQDLAGTLGVSKTTVSNAFSRPDQLSPDNFPPTAGDAPTEKDTSR